MYQHRKCDMTYRQKIIYRHFDIMTTNAFRAAAVINDACKKIADFHVGLDSQLDISPYTTLIIERVYCLTSPQPLGKSSHRRSKWESWQRHWRWDRHGWCWSCSRWKGSHCFQLHSWNCSYKNARISVGVLVSCCKVRKFPSSVSLWHQLPTHPDKYIWATSRTLRKLKFGMEALFNQTRSTS